jgi:glycosyltransferase involved in cell wall biosynthesis
MIRFLERHASALVCSSNAIAAQFDPAARIPVVTIYPGISESHGEGDGPAFRSSLGLTDASPLIAVVGNLTAARGQDVMIAALEEILRAHPRAHLVIAGAPHDRGPDLRYALGLKRSAGVEPLTGHVTFAGFVADINDVYAAADIVVNPARFNEPFGRAAPEALVAGCPVVATRVGAIPEVLRDGQDALLVEPDDVSELAHAVVALADDPERARSLAVTGRDRVLREFGVERVASEFERLAISLRA